MKNNLLFGLPVVLLLTMVFTPVYAPGHFFLSIDSAEIFENSGFISAKINVAGNIPIGTQAFGTGVVTTGTLAVTTTHPGVLDSETQNGNKDNAIQHNHYVNLNIPPLDAGVKRARPKPAYTVQGQGEVTFVVLIELAALVLTHHSKHGLAGLLCVQRRIGNRRYPAIDL